MNPYFGKGFSVSNERDRFGGDDSKFGELPICATQLEKTKWHQGIPDPVAFKLNPKWIFECLGHSNRTICSLFS